MSLSRKTRRVGGADRRGQGIVEWGLVVSLLALFAAAVLSSTGTRVRTMLEEVSDNVTSTSTESSQNPAEILDPDSDGGGVGGSGNPGRGHGRGGGNSGQGRGNGGPTD